MFDSPHRNPALAIIDQQQDRILILCDHVEASKNESKRQQIERSDIEMNTRFFPNHQGPKGRFRVTFGTFTPPQLRFTINCSVDIEQNLDGSQLAVLTVDPQVDPAHTLVRFKGQGRPCVPPFAKFGEVDLNNNLFVVTASEIQPFNLELTPLPDPCPIIRRRQNMMMQGTQPALIIVDDAINVDEDMEAELDKKYPVATNGLFWNMDTGKALTLRRKIRPREIIDVDASEEEDNNVSRNLFGNGQP